MKITLFANSSSGEPHKVEFLGDEVTIKVFCHCQAGISQMMCKHKLALIKGDIKMLFDPKQGDLLSQVQAWPLFASLKSRLEEYEKKLGQIENAKTELAAKERTIKKEFAHGLTFGFR
jgi:hypothetical protein